VEHGEEQKAFSRRGAENAGKNTLTVLCGFAALREKQKQSLAKAQSRKGKYVRF
jgi:hypothetical protein